MGFWKELFSDLDKPAFAYFRIRCDGPEEARIARDILQGTNSDEARKAIKANPELKKIARTCKEIDADYKLLE